MDDQLLMLTYKSRLSFGSKLSLMWSLIKEAEDLYTSQGNNIVNRSKIFQCTLCKKVMSSPYSTVEHVRGSQHQYELDRKYNCHNLPPNHSYEKINSFKLFKKNIRDIEGSGFGKNIHLEKNGFKCYMCNVKMENRSLVISHVKSTRHQQELGERRKLFPLMNESPLSYDEKLDLMWKMVHDAENGSSRNPNFGQHKLGKKFYCLLCDRSLCSPFNVVQHAQGKIHQMLLKEDQDSFHSDSDSDSSDCSFYYTYVKGW